MTELLCSRDIALWLGAISPETIAHHREMKAAGHLLLRDGCTGWPMFWPLREDLVAERSS